MTQSSLRTDELEYDLPQELIATRPAEPRDAARMLVLSRSSRQVEHRQVRDLPEYLSAGDAMVFNTTAVAPARLVGRRSDTGGSVEGLFLNDVAGDNGEVRWQAMLKAGGRLKPGVRIDLLDHNDSPSGLLIELDRRDGAEWIVRLMQPGASTQSALKIAGRTPLPPYILNARGKELVEDALDRAWYQTVYACAGQQRSVAAPTAGLHFTPDLLSTLDRRGVKRIDVTLHVGPGTFKPVTTPTLAEHRMHAEWFEVSPSAIARLRTMRGANASGRVIAVGTTSVRTLESLPQPLPVSAGDLCGPIAGMTDLLIAPPYEFKLVDGMLTNFHLPRSTLLALVAAMVGLDRLKSVYREAIRLGYRFYSYGDAMLILP